MTANDIRLFAEVTTRQAEEAFRRRIEESNRGVELQVTSGYRWTFVAGASDNFVDYGRQRRRENW